MWNKNEPLEILKSLPDSFEEENLKKIQSYVDFNKYTNSFQRGRDLCGEYADFCSKCVKSVAYPCAVSYLKWKAEAGKEEVAEPVGEPPERAEEAPVREKNKIRLAVAKRK